MFDESAIQELRKGCLPSISCVKFDAEKGVPFAIVPDNMAVESLKKIFDEYLEKPERVKGIITARNLESFVGMTNRFKNENSMIFFDGRAQQKSISASLLAVLNYHPSGGDDRDAEWSDHRVSYSLETSNELKTWLAKNGEAMSQADFAAFLENNAADLAMVSVDGHLGMKANFGSVTPAFATPSAIILLSRGIEIRANEKYHAAYRAENGTMNMQFTSQHEGTDGQPINVPQWFAVSVRIFEDGEVYTVPVRLRYRVKDGAVSWFYEIYRMQDIFEGAFFDSVDKAAKQTALTICKGSPQT